MGMRKQNGIELDYTRPQHLVSEIGRGVNNKRSGFALYQNTASKSFVFFMGRLTYLTIAPNHRHTAAGAGAQKSNGKRRIVHSVKLKIDAQFNLTIK